MVPRTRGAHHRTCAGRAKKGWPNKSNGGPVRPGFPNVNLLNMKSLLSLLLVLVLLDTMMSFRLMNTRGMKTDMKTKVYRTTTQLSSLSREKAPVETMTQKIPLIVNVYVDRDILTHLNMKNHERKNRILVSKGIETFTIGYLREV